MKYEYVALTWQTHHSEADPVFRDDMRELLDERWEEVCRASRAPFEPSRTGGACIMRRPKEEPQKYFHTRHCLCDECAKKKDEPRMWTRCLNCGYVDMPRMYTEEEIAAGMDANFVPRVSPRPVACEAPKDEPRMWTEAEIKEIAKGVLVAHVNLSAM